MTRPRLSFLTCRSGSSYRDNIITCNNNKQQQHTSQHILVHNNCTSWLYMTFTHMSHTCQSVLVLLFSLCPVVLSCPCPITIIIIPVLWFYPCCCWTALGPVDLFLSFCSPFLFIRLMCCAYTHWWFLPEVIYILMVLSLYLHFCFVLFNFSWNILLFHLLSCPYVNRRTLFIHTSVSSALTVVIHSHIY